MNMLSFSFDVQYIELYIILGINFTILSRKVLCDTVLLTVDNIALAGGRSRSPGSTDLLGANPQPSRRRLLVTSGSYPCVSLITARADHTSTVNKSVYLLVC